MPDAFNIASVEPYQCFCRVLGLVESGHDLVVCQEFLGGNHHRRIAGAHEDAVTEKPRCASIAVVEKLDQASPEKDQEGAMNGIGNHSQRLAALFE